MSSEFENALRRLKPEKHTKPLKPRTPAELTFIDAVRVSRSLLYDTTVYVDVIQGRFPEDGERLLRVADAWHSSVAENELASTCALLDPEHPETRHVVREITAVITRISPYRCLAPDRQVWLEAGILTGTLARLQGIAKADRRRILNDALIFGMARKHGHAVLTRNIADFDFLQQLDPLGRVAFYRIKGR